MISIGYVNNTLTPMTDAFFKEYTAEINDLYDDINFTCCEMAFYYLWYFVEFCYHSLIHRTFLQGDAYICAGHEAQ